MQIIEVKDLSARLSDLLVSVRSGEELLIRDEGRVIARLVPETDALEEEERGLQTMATEGLIEAPRVRLPKRSRPSVTLRGKPLSQTILEDRR